MGAPLTRDEILAVPDIKTERVAVPEWGGDVLIRTLTADERDAFEELTYTVRGGNVRTNIRGLRARLVSFSIVDDAGERLFSEEDIAALGRKSSAAMDRLYAACRRLSALDQRDVDELVGNSAPGALGDTPSDSPSDSAA